MNSIWSSLNLDIEEALSGFPNVNAVTRTKLEAFGSLDQNSDSRTLQNSTQVILPLWLGKELHGLNLVAIGQSPESNVTEQNFNDLVSDPIGWKAYEKNTENCYNSATSAVKILTKNEKRLKKHFLRHLRIAMARRFAGIAQTDKDACKNCTKIERKWRKAIQKGKLRSLKFKYAMDKVNGSTVNEAKYLVQYSK